MHNFTNAEVLDDAEIQLQKILAETWNETLSDNGKDNWQDKWFLDGKHATVTNDCNGMQFSAGNGDTNEHHAVLWTKESFTGDVRVEFEYIRLDDQTKDASMIYVQATGVGVDPYQRDISTWSNLRQEPWMRYYFRNMNLVHISFASYDKSGRDYVRLRQYPVPKGGKFNPDTEIKPAIFDFLEFKKQVPYNITIVKRDNQYFFRVRGDGKVRTVGWKLDPKREINEGRVGIRHMRKRSAVYKNIKIFGLSS
jgi:hypothetical protein